MPQERTEPLSGSFQRRIRGFLKGETAVACWEFDRSIRIDKYINIDTESEIEACEKTIEELSRH
jgi:hypothetical protein